jgi:ABC-type branched-subunit amino acid transport system ATPase component
MELQFKSEYISIVQFNPVEIADFTVLTGVNGSGKSHLLEAIEKKHVAISGMEQANIVLFNYETFRLENESAFNAQQLSAESESAWNYYQQRVRNNVQSWRNNLGADYGPLKESCETENKSFWSLKTDSVNQYKQNAKNHFNSPDLRNNQEAQGIYSLVKRLHYSIDEIEHDEFVRLYKPFVFKNDFLPNQLGKVFWDYYIKYRHNEVNEFQNEKHGKTYDVVCEDDFAKIHGEKPWKLVNQILETFDTLQYKVSSPEGSDVFGNFKLRLKHTEKDDLEIDFSSLSSGEKVLMALVASVYKSSSDRHFPDVLLLDEVDASLHPSMIQNMREVIKNIFLKQGVKVILVTHSPTTIALADEESVFVMNRVGLNRIEKKSRQDALAILTQGYATLEQGLKLFDEVTKSPLTIITEGWNTNFISKALEINAIVGVEVLAGVEGSSGKNQLKTVFDFLSKTQHKNKVIFVWDCDVTLQLQVTNTTFPFTLPKNSANSIAKKGIENMFPEELFEGYVKTITTSDGKIIKEFDENRKRDFEKFIISRNNADDFQQFSSLISEIKRVRAV